MITIFNAYWNLLFPRVPDNHYVLDERSIRKIVKEVARGNPSLQAGKYATEKERKAQKMKIIKHSFI
ncbi:hypothetical protein H8K33_12360 [Undibacterium amnicola]|uniref:Uncharacterized protein n=1 Tax=Undibacterium amnicola TaxID=1834038 RepID=A0ABR6XSJ3_9BURK|nr:hypothetical protein [Undibacterium amnicola]MBC3832308.1 hypothetical protein [Undibacterium amnicola]